MEKRHKRRIKAYFFEQTCLHMVFPFGNPQTLKHARKDYLGDGILQWTHTLYFTSGLLILLLSGGGGRRS